ncbi:ATP-binding cassette domain-containing protein [Aquabacterium sp.]|uniref:ATP-binding cassette domain-containing protein n=1 Tax=Aquabacterium sp. TaxID=1872578 RepID=UPI0019C41264|nr:ATP-binding cassette domain-containing protein [Aquabacterium sp.]MBC7699923.1 ATP-binding cassette domain-containing protein [Aquabacterium sp.]
MKIDVDIGVSVGERGRVFHLQSRFESSNDRLVLFGPSGVGKTLTIQAIAGLLRPDHGHIRLGERVLFSHEQGINVRARDRRVGYVFQDYALFPHLSVARNIAFGLLPTLPWRLSPVTRRQVGDIMQALDIGGLQDRLPATLSGGQRQRVALARALIRQPDLLLLDEPFSALDTVLRGRVRTELDEIRRRFGVPMILISHDPDDVRQFADTLVEFEAGRVVQVTHAQT